MSDKVYTYDEYVLSYDMGEENDRSCMTISKILNSNIYVMAELYDGSADVVSIMLDNLQQELQQKENIIKEVREWAKKYSCQFTNDDGELVVSEISFNIQARPCDLFKILDKEVN